MRVVLWIGIGLAACIAVLVAASIAACFSDGPIAILAGGPLVAGPPGPGTRAGLELCPRPLDHRAPARLAVTARTVEDGDIWLFELAPRPGAA